MKIRKAKAIDLKAIQKIARVLKIPAVAWADWHKLCVIREVVDEGRYYVAETAGRIVGIISIVPHGKMMEIGTLAVARSRHGEGIGKRLVDFARSFGKCHGAKRITVSSLVAYGAKPFYLHLGFSVRGSGHYCGRKWYEFVAAL